MDIQFHYWITGIIARVNMLCAQWQNPSIFASGLNVLSLHMGYGLQILRRGVLGIGRWLWQVNPTSKPALNNVQIPSGQH
jgi:hypothetical protein